MISLKNIHKSYQKPVLQDLSFQVSEGEPVALVGNNGCGKTTTLNVLCNLTGFQKGEYLFDNQKVTHQYVSFKSQLGIVLGEPYYIEEFSVREYWQFVAKFQKVPKTEIEKRITDLFNFLDLENDKKAIKNLSSGGKMKVSLGAALIHNPRVLILDEPFVNLDIATTEKVMQILKSFKGKKTIFITSHQLELVLELCDRFLIMQAGKISLELNKADYSDLESLKTVVKNQLISQEPTQNLEWL